MHRIVPKGYDEIIRDPRGFTAIASISLRELVAPFGCSLSTNIFFNKHYTLIPTGLNLPESGSLRLSECSLALNGIFGLFPLISAPFSLKIIRASI